MRIGPGRKFPVIDSRKSIDNPEDVCYNKLSKEIRKEKEKMKYLVNEIIDNMEVGKKYTMSDLTKNLTEKEKSIFRAYIIKNRTDKILLTEVIDGVKYYFRF